MSTTQMTSKPETRSFRMAPQLLMDVIKRQAGSISKAVLEGAMNAVDARATKFAITMNSTTVRMEDNGHGFGGRENIQKFFEVFGQPHVEGDATYGTFRMGRGQCFAFGLNTWRTDTHQMVVDIQGKGLDYDLIDNLPDVDGCTVTIDLYEAASPLLIQQTLQDLSLWVKYMPIEVTFNGERLDKSLGDEKWDIETEEAYIRLKESGTLSVYNLGVHVEEHPNHRYGTGGVVVSKQQLRVNFARNAVLSDCKVWRKISPIIQQRSTERNLKSPGLDDGGRDNLAQQIIFGQIGPKETLDARILTNVKGRHLTGKILNEWDTFTLAPRNNRLAESLMDQKIVLALSDELLKRFNCSDGMALSAKLEKLYSAAHVAYHKGLYDGKYPAPAVTYPKFVPFNVLQERHDSSFTVIPKEKWSPRTKAWIAILSYVNSQLHARQWTKYEWTPGEGGNRTVLRPYRHIIVGDTESTPYWTDGESYIAFNEKYLRSLEPTVENMGALTGGLIHSWCHSDDNSTKCQHGMEFYEEHHEAAKKNTGWVVGLMLGKAASTFTSAANQTNRKTMKDLEHVDNVKRAAVRMAGADAMRIALQAPSLPEGDATVVPPETPDFEDLMGDMSDGDEPAADAI